MQSPLLLSVTLIVTYAMSHVTVTATPTGEREIRACGDILDLLIQRICQLYSKCVSEKRILFRFSLITVG